MRSKRIAVLLAAVAILGTVPVFAAEPVILSPALPQPASDQPTKTALEQPTHGGTQSKYGQTAQEQPMYAQPADAMRFYTQWELHQASVYRSEPGHYRESGDGAGASGGDSSGN